MEEKRTDVLVIGAGAAGLSAGLTAALAGCDVLLLSKTPIFSGSCTVVSGGGFSLATGGLTADKHLEMTLQSGKQLNDPTLVRKLVEEAPGIVSGLEKLGLSSIAGKGYIFFKGRPPVWGREIVKALRASIDRAGVELWDRIWILELILDNGSIQGALAYDMASDRMIWLRSKAIVLATGGGGALYRRNDNPPGMTGDGYALALKAGATLRDMEFVQFYPMGIATLKNAKILAPSFLADTGTILNGRGEDILAKYGIDTHPVVTHCRDALSRAMYMEITEAGGDPPWAFLDIRGMLEDSWKDYVLTWGMEKILVEKFGCREKLVPISPTCHFFMGGVKVDSNCAAGVDGLYAAGEVVGGVHGANRMGGNALSEAVVFGTQAGKSAAHWAKARGYDSIGIGPIKDLAGKRCEVMGRKSSAKGLLASVRREIEDLLWNDVGIIRTKEGLARAMRMISSIESDLIPQIRVSDRTEVVHYWELRNALLVARCVAESALRRTESRGSHYRTDYPQQDDKVWLRSIEIKMRCGQFF